MQNRWIDESTLRFDIMAALALLCAAGIGSGCGTGKTENPSQSGGASGTGGSSGAGGASSASSTGGASGTGGLATGGASPTGGLATGGVNATGGAATGGASATGGSATGGASKTGGSATGGVSATGGSATGGASATGGSATGGASATGGSATGGASKTGGAASGGVGAGGSQTGGSATGGSTGGAAGTSAQGGTTSNGGSTGATGGSAACASRVLSLSANATGSAADTAYAHVEVDMKTDLPVENSARTIEFWALIKTADWVGEHNELYYYGSAGTAMAFGLDFGTNPVTGSTTNHATLNPFTNGGFTSDSTVDLGINSSTSQQWVHIAMTWDQTVLVTYVNGLPKITIAATGGVTALATVQSVLYIGCNPTNKNCFNGEFAEFRVWNVARSAAEILANYNKPLAGNETDLVGYWKFDDATGATAAADSVTSATHVAHPGTLTAATAAQDPTFIAPTTPLPLVCP